mmetsp:Transcript_18044/g.36471  ORF Transcript_18044/g.36471 Transcript_18044/m.36471 type:complete len:231 (-) Transcript_18044:613-1305(-)
MPTGSIRSPPSHVWCRLLAALAALERHVDELRDARDFAKRALWAEEAAHGHEEEEGVDDGEDDGPDQQQRHLGEEGERAQEQHQPSAQCRQPAAHHRRPHVRQCVTRLVLPAPGALLVHVAQVHRVVDREPDHDDAGNRLCDAQVPPVVRLGRPKHAAHDEGDGGGGKDGNDHVTGGEDQHDECDREADGEACDEVLDQSVFDVHPGPALARGLRVGLEQRLHALWSGLG